MSAVAELFANNLARYLEKSPLTQEQVAARAQINRTQIHKLLQGEQICRLDTAVKIAGALGIEPAKLIEDIRWDPGVTAGGEFVVERPKRNRD